MKIQYLGQAGIILESKDSRVLIDPYLSNYVVESGIGDPRYFSREFQPPLQPDEIQAIDFVFITHNHADHCDPLTLKPILTKNSACKVIGPQPVMDEIIRWGISVSRIIKPVTGVENKIDSISFVALPSAHYGLDQDETTGEYPYFGYVINLDHITLYHSGDTILYDGLVKNLRNAADHIDIACLPVNGRDKTREDLGIIGNLFPEEAAELASLIDAKVLIPMHNDLFKINQQDPEILNRCIQQKYPTQIVKWLQQGEVFHFVQK